MQRTEHENLPPGESVILNIPLMWTGEGQPQHIAAPVARQPVVSKSTLETPIVPDRRPPPFLNLVSFLLFIGSAYLTCRWFDSREEEAGRYKVRQVVLP